MRKMKCLFVREFHSARDYTLTDQVEPGLEWVGVGEGFASIKRDGTACMVRDGRLYKRYDYKRSVRDKGRAPPDGWERCDPEPDPITGHWPGWVPVDENDPGSHMHVAAYREHGPLEDGTYELVGPKIGRNPEGVDALQFIRHGSEVVEDAPRDRDGLREFLRDFPHEGLVFRNGDQFAKIRRSDFGFQWPLVNR